MAKPLKKTPGRIVKTSENNVKTSEFKNDVKIADQMPVTVYWLTGVLSPSRIIANKHSFWSIGARFTRRTKGDFGLAALKFPTNRNTSFPILYYQGSTSESKFNFLKAFSDWLLHLVKLRFLCIQKQLLLEKPNSSDFLHILWCA